MFKKLIILAALAFSLSAAVSAQTAVSQFPTPPCLPCDGGGGN
jgi:hypothetical protein